MVKEHVGYTSSVISNFKIPTPLGIECTGIHVKPEKIQNTPIVYAIGWGTDTTMHLPPMKSLAGKGFDVWSVNPPRKGSSRRSQEELPSTEIESNKANSVVSLLKHLHESGVEQVDMVAHSEGAIYASLAALKALEIPGAAKVRSIILVEPAGLMGKDSVVKLASRFARQAFGNVIRNPNLYVRNRKSGRGIFSLRTSVHEALAIAEANLSDLLKILTENGIKIGIIGGNFDSVFPAREIVDTLQTGNLNIPFSTLDIRHNGIYAESEFVMTDVDRMLHELNNSALSL